jgi:NAD(P)H dehydrogenase (quinone)
MTSIAIVYHSGFGHTKGVAERVLKGAASVAGVTATLVNVGELPAPGADRSMGGRWAELNAADAIIFGSPTYMGDISAPFKKFMEDSSGIWFGQGWKDKIAAGFTNSGGLSGDKLHALQTIATFAGQHSMIWVSTGVMPSEYTRDGLNLNRLSSFTGLMTQAHQAAPEESPIEADKLTAERFGKRVAEAAVRWTKGR